MCNKQLYLFIHALVLSIVGGTFSGAAQFCPPGDLTNDCEVDSRDVAAFGLQWLDPQGMCSGSECANLDGINGVQAVDFVLLADDWRKKGEGLVINEFMASNLAAWEDPDKPGLYPDWIELYNATNATIDLAGMYLTDELNKPTQYQIPAGVTISSGQHLVFVADKDLIPRPTHIHTNFELAADGEEVGLVDVDGVTMIDSLDFGDLPQSTDISYGRYPDAGEWRYLGTPTPTEENQAVSVPPLDAVRFNEILSHSHLDDPDWIELYNTTDTAINLSGWFLTDSGTIQNKYEIPEGTIIEPDDYVVFYEDQSFGDGNMAGSHVPFALSENGETLHLRSAIDGQVTGYYKKQAFRAAESNVAFGKYIKSTGTYNFVAMSENTPGGPNAYPKVGPVVINEIMYNPDDPQSPYTDKDEYEYVELLNITDGPVILYDDDPMVMAPWKFTDKPDSTSLVFFFPSGTPVVMSAGEYILLVRNLAAFNSRHGGSVPSGTQIFQWSNGGLSNSGDDQPQLSMPGDVDNYGIRQYIRVDRVSYDDRAPWPTGPDGDGQALTRKVPSEYGNDPINWKGATPSPGRINP